MHVWMNKCGMYSIVYITNITLLGQTNINMSIIVVSGDGGGGGSVVATLGVTTSLGTMTLTAADAGTTSKFTCAHAHIHTRARAYTHTRTRIYTHAHAHIHTRARAYTHTRTRIYTHTRTCYLVQSHTSHALPRILAHLPCVLSAYSRTYHPRAHAPTMHLPTRLPCTFPCAYPRAYPCAYPRAYPRAYHRAYPRAYHRAYPRAYPCAYPCTCHMPTMRLPYAYHAPIQVYPPRFLTLTQATTNLYAYTCSKSESYLYRVSGCFHSTHFFWKRYHCDSVQHILSVS